MGLKTPCFHCRGHVFNPWSGNEDPIAVQPKVKKNKANHHHLRYTCGAHQLEPHILTSFPPCPTIHSPDLWTEEKSKCCLWTNHHCALWALGSVQTLSPGSAFKKQVTNSHESLSRLICHEHILMWFWKADTNMLVTSINSASSEESPEPLFTHVKASKTQGGKNMDYLSSNRVHPIRELWGGLQEMEECTRALWFPRLQKG